MLFERRLQGRIKDELKIEGILNRQRHITIPMVGTLGAKEFARMQTLRKQHTEGIRYEKYNLKRLKGIYNGIKNFNKRSSYQHTT